MISRTLGFAAKFPRAGGVAVRGYTTVLAAGAMAAIALMVAPFLH